MYARALQDAETQLVELRHDELHRIGLGAAALGASLAATAVFPPLVFPLFLGGLTMGALGGRAVWRHWDLVDRLADDRDAYVIPDVRAYAARDTAMGRRRSYAATIHSWTGGRGLPADDRSTQSAVLLDELARELEDAELELDPACALACRRLLTDPSVSPLLNPALPDDLAQRIGRIRAGFRPRTRS
jgi:hypothetical protein